MKNSWKRIAAGAMSLAMVAGVMTANVGGLLTGGNGIVASAADVNLAYNVTNKNTIFNYGDNIVRVNNATNTWVIVRPGHSNVTLNRNNRTLTSDDDYVVSSRTQSGNTYTLNLKKLITGDNTSIDDVTFNGNNLTPTIKRTVGEETTTLGSSDFTVVEIRNSANQVVTTVKDAGTYKVKINGAGDYSTAFTGTGNNNGQSGVELTWTVANADVNVTEPTAKTLTYTGAEQELVNAGSVAGNAGTIQYRLGTTGEWSTSIPKATDAGDYTVYYKVVGDNNHNNFDPTSPIQVTIAQKSISDSSITVDTIETQDYTSEAVTPEPVVKDGTTTLTKDTDYTVAYSDNTNVGTAKITITGKGNYNSNKVVNYEIDYATVGLRLNNLDGAVLTKTDNTILTATDGVYSVKGHGTYYLYTNSFVPTEGIVDSQTTNKSIGGNTYEYRYTIIIPDVPNSDGYMLSHTNNWKGKVPNDSKEILYVYEDNEEELAVIGAELSPAEIYYYGDTPSIDVVDIKSGFGNIVKVIEVFFSDASGAKVVKPSAGGASHVTANVIVNKSGSEETGENTDFLVMSKAINYIARPLNLCDIYFVNGDTETKLTIDANNNVTVPAGAFTYDGEEKAPVIVVKNSANDEIVSEYNVGTDGNASATDAGDYSFVLNADSVTTDNYSGTLTVNWKINKATIENISAEFNGKIYDGIALNSDDFTFTNEQPNLIGDDNTVISVTDSSENAIVNAGTYVAKIKISNPNYINYVITVEDNEIQKRKVTLNPVEDQSMTFGESAPVIIYWVDLAKDMDGDGAYDTNEDVVPTDLENNQPAVLFLGDAVKIGKEISTTNKLKEGAEDAFDYDFFVNDAGTYSYTINADVIAAKPNYELVLAEGGVFTINKKTLTEDLFDIDEPGYVYDGNAKAAPDYSIVEETFTNDVAKLAEGDFVVGGTPKAILPGQYTLEFDADDVENSNYTGWISYDWTIKSSKKYTAQVNAENFVFGTKTADEAVSTIIFKSDDENETPINISGAQTTYTFYQYDGQAEITPEYIDSLTPIDILPVTVGRYIVVAHTTARGYEFDDTFDTFTIQTELTDANITVTGISLIGADGWAHPNDSIKVNAVVNGVDYELIAGEDYDIITASKTKNTGSFSVQIEGKGIFTGLAEATVDVISDFSQVIDLSERDAYVAINPANNKLYVQIGFTHEILNDKYSVAETGIIYSNTGKITDISELTLENVDDNDIKKSTKVLTNILDKSKGVIAVGYVKIRNQAGDETVVYTKNIGGKSVTLAESAPSATINPATGDEYVQVRFTATIDKKDYTVSEYGILYNNNGSITDAADLTLDSVDGTDIRKSTKSLTNIRDYGDGVVAVGYAVVKNSAGQEAIIYTDDIGGKYSELAQ